MIRVGERPDPVGEAYLYGGVAYRARRDDDLLRARVAGGHEPLLPHDADYMRRWREAGGAPMIDTHCVDGGGEAMILDTHARNGHRGVREGAVREDALYFVEGPLVDESDEPEHDEDVEGALVEVRRS